MADMKNENVNPNPEEQQETPANQDNKAKKEPGKIKSFLSKHGKKIKTGLAIAGAVGVGVIADRVGISIGGKKKQEDAPADPE